MTPYKSEYNSRLVHKIKSKSIPVSNNITNRYIKV